MNRRELTRSLAHRLGRRTLIWAGIRGDDIEPLADLPQLGGAFSIAGSFQKRSDVAGIAYEDLTGQRVDPEVWDIDDHLADEATHQFRLALLDATTAPSALLPYRPSRFLSALWFARKDRCLNLGLFGAHQSAFEHKPWVETAVADELGLPHIPWTYIADEEQFTSRELLAHGPLMLRRSRTSGGEGLTRVESVEELEANWPYLDESFVSVAPFIQGGLPLNVGATAWRDGVTVHHPSVQLVGVPELTSRPFGHCGNDFTAAADLAPHVLDQMQGSTEQIGDWLRGFGYRGTFGVDFLLVGDDLLFTEVNARFQGSTHASCRLSAEAGESCLMLEHVAAMLGLSAPEATPLRQLVTRDPPLTNVVVHWTGAEPASLDPRALIDAVVALYPETHADVRTNSELVTDPGATAVRLQVPASVVERTGEVDGNLRAAVATWVSQTGPKPQDQANKTEGQR